MGIKETGDYLTARGANPRTGLISPSVVIAQTPRTPMTPGEALRLYNQPSAQSSPLSSRTKPVTRKPKQIATQWKQSEKGWFMETVIEVAPTKSTTANISTPRETYLSPDDRFIIPMPSANDPQPYRDPSHSADQLAALEHYRDKSSRRVSPSGLNGRMYSIGAGPRKFAEASKKLRTQALERQAPDSPHVVHQNRTAESLPEQQDPIAPAPPLHRSTRSSSVGSIDSVATAIKDMPGGFADAHGSPKSITRKPVGSPVLKQSRRGSDATVITATSADEKEVFSASPPPIPVNRPREDTNARRFQDLRQLPRVRIVHPDHAASLPTSGGEESQHISPSQVTGRIFTLLEAADDDAPLLPYPRHSLMPSPSPSPIISAPELSMLERQVMDLLAYTISFLHRISLSPWKLAAQTQSQHNGVIHALNTLTNDKAEPWDRLNAGKTLLLMAGKAVVALMFLVVGVKVAVAVWRVLEVLFWPVRVVFLVVGWVMGVVR